MKKFFQALAFITLFIALFILGNLIVTALFTALGFAEIASIASFVFFVMFSLRNYERHDCNPGRL